MTKAEVELTLVRANDGSLNDILQFTHVAGPVVGLKLFHVRRRQTRGVHAEFAGGLLEKMLRQLRNVLSAVAQRRQFDGEDAQAIVEVLAEATCLYLVGEGAIRRGDDAHVHGAGAFLADFLELAFLQDAQQLALEFQRHFADFIQKQRAAIGEFKAAHAVLYCARKRATDVAEELTLKQFARHGGAINPNERCGLARAAVVDRAGDQFLARTGFTQDQHVGVGRSDHLNLREHLLERRAVADDGAVIAAQFFLQILVLELQVLALLDAGE